MSPALEITLSGVLTFGVPLAFAARELAMLRRPGGLPPRRREADTPRLPTPGSGPVAAPRPLPACLLPPPRPAAARPRVAELV
jgi:hypothetical protein